MSHRLLCLAVVFIALAACKKSSNTPSFKLVNNTQNVLVVNMYTSKADLANKTNVAFSCQVQAMAKYDLPKTKIDSTQSYLFDIYTLDYKLSNWPGTAHKIGGNVSGEFNLSTDNLTAAQYYYLHGDLASSTWVAVNQIDFFDKSYWATLNDVQKYHQLVLNRDGTGLVIHKQDDNTIITDSITGMSATEAEGRTILNIHTKMYAFRYNTYNTPNAPGEEGGSVPPRTDILQLHDSVRLWTMVRQ